LAQVLRARHQRLMVLMVSGTIPASIQEHDVEALPKPYNEASLTAKVRELLRRAKTEESESPAQH
jgi:DNA-binding response OmpR family regulator